jgi:hypothetical protein
MKTIAIGPEKDVPSWNWVGFDTGRELSKYYDVQYFESFKTPPKVDAIVVIKQTASKNFIMEGKSNGTRMIYVPIDFYLDLEHLENDGRNLSLYDAVISHSDRLSSYIRRYCKNITFVDHNSKYALPVDEISPYREEGFVLWIGGCQYVAYLCEHLRKHPLFHPVKILTDFRNDRARFAANNLATELGLSLKLTSNSQSIHGHEIYEWTERTQYEMMGDCKAAIDIKGANDWNQKLKPPTKAQKYIASSIPFAINSGSYSAEYFAMRGFQITSPLSQDRWFSKEYWKQTREFSNKVRETTSIEEVGKIFRGVIEG